MAIGQKDFVTKKSYSGASTDAVTLEWGDDNVQMFEGTGAKTVYLPAGNVANSYGEVWISNSQASGSITISHDTASTGNIQNQHGAQDHTLALGETGHYFYVPYLRNAAKPLHDEKIDGQARGMWVGGILGTS